MGIYEGSVSVNQEWAERSRDLGTLHNLAQRTNAPGNDVFDTQDVSRERGVRDTYLVQFETQYDLVVSEIENEVDPTEAQGLLQEMQSVDIAMGAMVQHANDIFRHFEQGEPELAGRMMATMDRSFGSLNFAISRAIEHVQDIQSLHLSEQIDMAADIKKFEYIIGGMIVFMVICVAIYGHKIGQAMKVYHEELHTSHDQSISDAAELARQNKELGAAKNELEHISMHDHLSGLPNRRSLESYLAEVANQPAVERDLIAVLHIDLDKFKQINDTLGHDAGDEVLVSAAKSIQDCCGEGDFVARVGGDEFVAITEYGNRYEHPLKLAERILDKLRVPIPYEGKDLRIGASIGIACQEELTTSAKSLFIKADIALYRAKHLGRNRYELFTADLHEDLVNKQRTIDDIRYAVENENFEPHYQIQVNAQTHEIVGVEALARMLHPKEGILSPARFMGEAEEIGVVDEIDRIIMDKASGDFRRWKEQGLGLPQISLNVSAKRLTRRGLVSHCRTSGFKPGELSFELVETVFLDKPDAAIMSVINELKEIGVGIEIDDFGTGHASILSVLSISPSRLKLDRGFTSTMHKSTAQINLVKSIVEFGRSLGIEIVAEGVETMEQANLLRDIGCQYLKGFVFSKPVQAEELAELLRMERQGEIRA